MRDLTPPSQSQQETEVFPTQGGADDFRRFIVEELKPWVEERYRTNAYSALTGHSLGGLFALHTFITRPEAFNSYIVIDPSANWNDLAIVTQADTFLAGRPDLNAALYLAVSNEQAPESAGLRGFVSLLRAKTPSGLRWNLTPVASESQETIPLPGTYLGLRWLFENWDLEEEATALFGDSSGASILADVDELYRGNGEDLGFERETPTPYSSPC